MLKNILQFTVIFLMGAGLLAFKWSNESAYSQYQDDPPKQQMPKTVEEVLLLTGNKKPLHYIAEVDLDSARMGEEMVKYGELMDGSNKRISKFFVCTDCHNLQPESADPADESPEAVLAYGKKNKLPFLPASTFYGMYNKTHWYNGDYYKKYGDLVNPTRDTLYNAIQLCATQCAQGRELENWEVRSILHYFKTLEFKLSDLKFSQAELDQFGKYWVSNKAKAANLVRSKFNETNPATFGTSEIPVVEGYQPNMENGKYIFNYGCLHCHGPEKDITNFSLNDDKLSLKFLYKKRNKYNHYAVPHITRYGTYAITGRRQYMPLYSFEKMSDKQLLDLMYYIEERATK